MTPMTLPHNPQTDGKAHDEASQRLEAALDAQERVSEESDGARGGTGELSANVELAAANEQVAAREAWLKYVEHGY